MYHKVKKYMKENCLLSSGDRVLLALSGGADSVCLLRILLERSREMNIDIHAVHVHHMLREETADRDERFVRELCGRYEIPLSIFHKDVSAYAKVHKMTLEEAGRVIRYQCFSQVAEEFACNKIALAHHQDDLAETMLFRMIRGTGIKGLAAMKARNGIYIRPLLSLSKGDILEYLQEIKQDYVTDESNADITYSRNYIRQKIMPAMRKINHKADAHMAALSKQVEEFDDYLQKEIEKHIASAIETFSYGTCLDLHYLNQLHSFLQKELIRQFLYQVAPAKKDLDAVHVEVIWSLIHDKNGDMNYLSEQKCLNLPYGLTVYKKGSNLYVCPPGQSPFAQKESAAMQYPISFCQIKEGCEIFLNNSLYSFRIVEKETADYTNNDCIKYFDYDKITRGLCIRNKREGDYFVMDQFGHEKSLRRFFIDAKIPRENRDKQMLLADGSHIIWIFGHRISEAYKITESTEHVLQVILKEGMEKNG